MEPIKDLINKKFSPVQVREFQNKIEPVQQFDSRFKTASCFTLAVEFKDGNKVPIHSYRQEFISNKKGAKIRQEHAYERLRSLIYKYQLTEVALSLRLYCNLVKPTYKNEDLIYNWFINQLGNPQEERNIPLNFYTNEKGSTFICHILGIGDIYPTALKHAKYRYYFYQTYKI